MKAAVALRVKMIAEGLGQLIDAEEGHVAEAGEGGEVEGVPSGSE